jgi:lipopolysaccharide exporter
MSLARKATQGAMWTVGTSLATRVLGLVGSLVIARFLTPDKIADPSAAWDMIMSASLLTGFGLGNYYIVKGGGREIGFHMTVYSLLLGAVGLGLVWILDEPLSASLGLPTIAQYVPGLILAGALRRIIVMPQRVLVHELRFRRLSMARAAGEITYVVSSLGLAWAGHGGFAIVYANVLQYGVEALLVVTAVSWREWLQPCRLDWKRTKDMFGFGLPLGFNAFLSFGSQNWHKLIYGSFFGSWEMGLYQYGYRLAEIPAAQIGDQINDVLLPSMAKLDPQGRARALTRSTALLGLVIFPLTLGLAVVAEPLMLLLFSDEWHGVGGFVAILSGISIFLPLSSTLGSFLISYSRTRAMMIIEVLKLLALVVGMKAFSLLGPLWICAGVVASCAVHALLCAWLCVRRYDISATGLTVAVLRPLLACVPMILAVLAVRHGLLLFGMNRPVVSLVFEILVGILVYVPSAFVIAPAITHDFLDLLRKALRRGG